MRRLGVVVLLASCSSAITADNYAAAVRDATCDLRVRCGQFTDRDSCAAYFPAGDGANLAAELHAGKTTFDANRAEECINDLRNTPCDATSEEARTTPAACDAAITGTGATGAVCLSNDECQSAACELGSTCTGACCAGTCAATQALAELGEPCATRECKANLTCANTKLCVALYADGMPCDDGTQCAYGLGCVGTPGICHPLPKLGEACPDGQCAELGAYCNTSGVCAPLGLTGAACTTLADCSLYYPCNSGSLQCEPWPETGEPCTALCSDGSFCDATTFTCTSPLANGSACKTDDQCASTSCNDAKVCADVEVCEAS
ncbi:MAG: hypothetical protein ABI467_26315 [Kofleriaceae bacterium]